MIHLLLFFLIILHAFCDAAMDANAHLRIHLALHPLKDAWHLQKHISRASLIGIGLVYPLAHWDDRWAACIALACGVIIGRAVWDATYRNPWVWFLLDELVKVRTGIKWLDKWLGIHW